MSKLYELKKNKYCYKYIQFTVSSKEKQKIEDIAKIENFKTTSDFARRIIFDYIRRKENPDVPLSPDSSEINPLVVEKLMKKTQEVLNKQELLLQREEVIENMNEMIRDMKQTIDRNTFEKERKITINIPKGAYTGLKMKLRGEGMVGIRGGPPGDLIIVVSISDHDIFVRDGQHILLKLPITYSQAVLGDKIKVPTLDSEVGQEEKHELKIPSGTHYGDVFIIKNKGFPIIQKHRGYDDEYLGRGNQMIQVYFDVPKKVTKEQKEILKKLKDLGL